MITIYGTPQCQKCRLTKLHLDRFGVPYVVRDVSSDEAAADQVSLMGYGPGTSLPVVAAGDQHWSDFRADKLNQVIEVWQNNPHVFAEHETREVEAATYLMGS